MDAPLRFQITAEEAGERLDRVLARRLEKPRNQVQRWIEDGRVRVGTQASAKASTLVSEGDEIACQLPAEPPDAGVEPEAGELRVLYEDADLAILDKPAGIVVHPGAGRRQGTIANFLLHRYPEIAGVGGSGRPGIVHRLDLDTTGVLVAARREAAYLKLSRAFAERQVEKTYLAIVYGEPKPVAGTIELAIARDPRDRKRMTVLESGRPARSLYRSRASAAGLALVEVAIETGRTHQVRVHLKAIRHPLVGDPVYGEARWRGLPPRLQARARDFPRPALHAWKIAFAHPEDGRRIRAEAPIPDDLRQLWTGVTGGPWPLP